MFLVNIEKCLKIFDRVYCSSNSMNMLRQASAMGAIPIYRDDSLCGDTPNIPVYKHAMKVMQTDGFIAVQANSPTIDPNLIRLAKKFMETGVEEIMTCNEKYEIYGSIWGMSRDRLENYGDPYKPTPETLIVDKSIDIHTKDDYHNAIREPV